VDINFDSAKREKNMLAWGIPFELAAEFACNKAHVISLRKANKREVK